MCVLVLDIVCFRCNIGPQFIAAIISLWAQKWTVRQKVGGVLGWDPRFWKPPVTWNTWLHNQTGADLQRCCLEGGGALHTCSLSLLHHLEDTKHLLDPSLSDWTFVISLQLTPRSEAECFNSEAVSDTVCLYLKGQYCPAFGLADDKIKRKKLWAGRSNDAATKQSVKLSIKTGNNKLPCF